MSNFSKSVNSFGATVFFQLFSRMWLSLGGAKSQNECATPGLSMNKPWCHGFT